MFQGSYEAAKEQAGGRRISIRTFFFPQMVYGWADIDAGKFTDAIPSLKKAKALESPAFVTAWLAYAYAGVRGSSPRDGRDSRTSRRGRSR